MFPIVDRFGAGTTVDEVRQHSSDRGKLIVTRRSPYPPTTSLICTMGAMPVWLATSAAISAR
jgi:hypothetical protein